MINARNHSFISFLTYTSIASMLAMGISLSSHAANDSLLRTESAFIDVAQETEASVVHIQVSKAAPRSQRSQGMPPGLPFGEEFFDRFFKRSNPNPPLNDSFEPHAVQRARMGQGSGFIINKNGFILTNNHVIEDADEVNVVLNDGREFEAEVVGSDPQTDVGVVKIDAEALQPVSLGDSDEIQVGEWVVANGTPFGLSNTITTGVISAKGRSSIGITDYEDFIQTDAAINPGNSGGPLLNLEGEVIGINTAIFSRTGGYMGIGFAIPINMAKKIFDEILEYGEVNRGYLGVYIQPLTQDMAKAFDIDPNRDGIVIANVNEDSPAEKAGLKSGDVIVDINGEDVTDIGSFRNEIAFMEPGSKLILGILRNGDKKTVTITIGELDSAMTARAGQDDAESRLGFSAQAMTPELAERFGMENARGIVVTEVESGSDADRQGLRPGNIITEANRKPVESIADLNTIVSEADSDEPILLYVYDGQSYRFLTITPEDS